MADAKATDKDQKQPDILDDVRRIEAEVKKVMLMKMLGEVKDMAHSILEMKEKCSLLLAEIGVSDADSKRIIDFVNSLGSVQIKDDDRESLKRWAKQRVEAERKGAEKKAEEHALKIFPMNFYGDSSPFLKHPLIGNAGVHTGDNPEQFQSYTTCGMVNDNPNVVLMNDQGGELKIKL